MGETKLESQYKLEETRVARNQFIWKKIILDFNDSFGSPVLPLQVDNHKVLAGKNITSSF